MDSYRVHEIIDHHVKSMPSPWHGTINIPVHKWKPWDTMELIQNNKPELVDIVTYLDRRGGDVERLYVCFDRKPLPSNPKDLDGKACEGWKNLKVDIDKAAISGKSPVICNGGYTCKTGKIAKIFKCMSCHFVKKESPKSVSSENKYCITTLINNHQNGHGKQGNNGPKSIKTTTKDIISKFSLTIKVDHLGFYIDLKNQSGHPIHTGNLHPYESDTIPIPS